MSVVKEAVKCPFCKEPIAVGAVRCKHCHADLKPAQAKKPLLSKYNNFRVGFLSGILFTIIIILLSYMHFYSG